jgi:CBS domain-containing protein
MRVKELMSEPAVSCQTGDSVDRAAMLMWDRDCGAIPVVGADGRVAGIITDRDICMAALFQGRPLREIAVADAMTTDVCTCQAGDDVARAEQMMSERQVRRLPVVTASGEPVGMLSLSDIAQAARQASEKHANGRREPDGEFVATIATISQPRQHTGTFST